MLSATAEHALRSVLLLARLPEPFPFSADALARALGAPQNYLSKTLNALAKAGIVHSCRGPAGGFTLAIPVSTLTIAQVTAPFRESRGSPVCLLADRPCDRGAPCAAHARWRAIADHSDAAMERTTIAELLGEETTATAQPAEVTETPIPIAAPSRTGRSALLSVRSLGRTNASAPKVRPA